MKKYGKWMLTLSLLATTSELSFAADPQMMGRNPSNGARAPRIDNQRMADNIATALQGRVSADLGIRFRDGVAELTGTVTDPSTKELATSLAGQVPNVVRVDNRITVVEKKRSILDRARGKSPANEVIQAGHSGGNINRQNIQQVRGVAPQFAGPESGGMYPPGSMPGQNEASPNFGSAPTLPPIAAPSRENSNLNQETALQIGAVLSEARLDGYDIQIRYANGVATLEGTVGTMTERESASRAASAVPGVRSVSNRLVCSEERGMQPSAPGGPRPTGYGQPQPVIRNTGYMQTSPPMANQMNPGIPGGQGMGGGMPMGQGQPAPPYPPAYGNQGAGASPAVYNSPNMPDHAWPTYAQYPNSAAVSYPQQYSASAWPYIGPFYPYPQVPLGWRDATLRWDDGQWNLMFKPRTDRWWWFLNPNNW